MYQEKGVMYMMSEAYTKVELNSIKEENFNNAKIKKDELHLNDFIINKEMINNSLLKLNKGYLDEEDIILIVKLMNKNELVCKHMFDCFYYIINLDFYVSVEYDYQSNSNFYEITNDRDFNRIYVLLEKALIDIQLNNNKENENNTKKKKRI